MKIHERLKALREEKGLNKTELSREIGINYSTYANYESGLREPDSKVLKILSNYYDVSIDYILGLTDNKQKTKGRYNYYLNDDEKCYIEKYRNLDIYGKKAVDSIIDIETRRLQTEKKSREEFSSELHEIIKCPIQEYEEKVCAGTGNYLDYTTAFITYLDYKPPRGTDFIVSVQGDSMEPTISDGDRLFIKKAKKLDYGDIGIFYIPPDGLVVKEYTGEGLKAHNKKYPLVPGNAQIEIIGKVLGIVK